MDISEVQLLQGASQHPQLLIRGKKERQLNRSINIFEDAAEDDRNPSLIDRETPLRRYSLVGDRLFVDSMMQKLQPDPILDVPHKV